ncbi:hypothetical protein GJ496_006370 [Pomphorhynchus laevis]|nr:hypothetical protein GJ496_006370 [Pomphorhynchus laevis]
MLWLARLYKQRSNWIRSISICKPFSENVFLARLYQNNVSFFVNDNVLFDFNAGDLRRMLDPFSAEFNTAIKCEWTILKRYQRVCLKSKLHRQSK